MRLQQNPEWLHGFVEQERRRHHGRILAICPVVLVRADKTGHGLRLGLWAEELQLPVAKRSLVAQKQDTL
jgi:hypothetical protein